MKEHYGFTDQSYDALIKNGVSVMDLFKCVDIFDKNNTGKPISYVNLFYYLDEKGDFNKPPFFAHKKIAKAFYDQLKSSEKLEVIEYINVCM